MNKTPFSERFRPENIGDFVGQEHLIGEGRPLRKMFEDGILFSSIFWGPPGCGKSTLAKLMFKNLNTQVIEFNAAISGMKEVKEAMIDASYFFERTGKQTIIFVDEIHRFNRAQQDGFLPFLEKGKIILIGTTTLNPSFEINGALLSRVNVYRFKPLSKEDVVKILMRIVDVLRNEFEIYIKDDILDEIAVLSIGDARGAINILEQMFYFSLKEGKVFFDREILEVVLRQRVLKYDKKGEEHYNMLSALHKSMRNSDPDAAVYWVTRMLESGEEPENILRRIIQCASEDVGLADINALNIAVNALHAYNFLGLPEGKLAILQAAIYVSIAPKSNSVYKAYKKVQADIKKGLVYPVPFHLRNSVTDLMKREGYGDGYMYAHDFEHGISPMKCLPDELSDKIYYEPTNLGLEARIKGRLSEIKKIKKKKK